MRKAGSLLVTNGRLCLESVEGDYPSHGELWKAKLPSWKTARYKEGMLGSQLSLSHI